MSYATRQNMIDRFGERELIQLTDRAEPQTNAIDDTVLNAALADADDRINSYLSKRHTLPLATVPTVLVRICADFARWFLYDDGIPDAVESAFKEGKNILESYVKGNIDLGIASADPDESGSIEIDQQPAIFGRSKMRGIL